MLRIFVIAMVIVGCHKESDAVVRSSKVPVVPDQILERIGSDADMVIAADIGNSNFKAVLDQLPGELACVRDVINHAGIVTVAALEADAVGYVTNLPKTATRDCVQKFATGLGYAMTETATGFDLDLPGRPISVVWQDSVATIAQRGHTFKGQPKPELMRLLAKAPSGVRGVIAQYSTPSKRGIKSMNGWLEVREDVFVVTVEFEGDAPGDAVKAANDLVAGGKQGTAAKGVTLDDKWFVIKDNGLHASVVATIPYAAFQHT